ncbi:MAG TPA: hypothetical protein VGM88_22680 [Kofleriaceae bacterium]|jgi:hypothetical protein
MGSGKGDGADDEGPACTLVGCDTGTLSLQVTSEQLNTARLRACRNEECAEIQLNGVGDPLAQPAPSTSPFYFSTDRVSIAQVDFYFSDGQDGDKRTYFSAAQSLAI